MIDRKLYKGSFEKTKMNSWMCPTCHKSTLQVNEKKFILEENAITKQYRNYEDFQIPNDIVYTFTALLTCMNPECEEVITSSGTGFIDISDQISTPDGGYETIYENYFTPVHFYPPLHIFQIPEKTPKNVKNAILASFSLVFNNKSSAANQVRIAIECLLTHLNVNQYQTSGGKKRRLTLHRRIALLSPKHKKIKEICLAIKWLGNAGSHCDDKMTFDDVFDGYDMLSFVLEELYDNKHTHVKKMAKKINDKKGI